MEKKRIIFIIEEDKEDLEILETIINQVCPGYDGRGFSSLTEAFGSLDSIDEKPFMIICNSNWRNKNQTKFKELIEDSPDLKIRSIPFIFYAAQVEEAKVNDAFKNLNIQGYFEKKSDYSEIQKDIKAIIDYWERSKTPTYVE